MNVIIENIVIDDNIFNGIDYCILIPGLFFVTFRSIVFFTYDYVTARHVYSKIIKKLNSRFIDEFPIRIYTMILVINLISLYGNYNRYKKYPEKTIIDKCKKCNINNEMWVCILSNFIWASINHDLRYIQAIN